MTTLKRIEDLDLTGYRVLPDRPITALEPGDRIERAGLVATVRSNKSTPKGREITFDNAPAITVGGPMWEGAAVTIYRPRAGF